MKIKGDDMQDSDLFYLYSMPNIEDTILVFKGSLSQDVLVGMGEILLDNLSKKLAKTNTKRMFSVFVELTQNIQRYSSKKIAVDDKKIGFGIICVEDLKDKYIIVSGNLVNSENVKHLTEQLDYLNNLSMDDLKKLRKTRLRSERLKGSMGAGIGFIDIIRKSGFPIRYEIMQVDETHSFVSFYIEFRKGE